MIVLILAGAHKYTHKVLLGRKDYDFRMRSYNNVLKSAQLERATYIFSDLDRLGFWELELAAHVHRALSAAGARVLNDPARALHRFSLLRQLKDNAFNTFDVWRADEGRLPDRYPVFLRTQSAHRGPLTDLLATESEARAAIAGKLAAGFPLRDLMFVEYCAQPAAPGVYRKLSVFRLGPRMAPSISVHQGSWAAKFGELGIAGQALYDEEREIVRSNRFGDIIRPAFELAGIDYGRADFALVDGKPQIYEINTNPTISPLTEHPFPVRLDSDRDAYDQYHAAMAALDTPAGGKPWRLDSDLLAAQRSRDRLVAQARWTV